MTRQRGCRWGPRAILLVGFLVPHLLWGAETFGVRTSGGRTLFEFEGRVGAGETFLTITFPPKGREEGESSPLSEFFKGIGGAAEAVKYFFLGIDGHGTIVIKSASGSKQENLYFRLGNEGRSIITLPTFLKDFPRLRLEIRENQDSTISLRLLNRPQEKR